MRRFVAEMWPDGWVARSAFVFMLLLVLALLASIPVLISKVVEERRLWRQFAAEHHCIKVGEVSGDFSVGTGVSVSPDGKIGVVTTTSTTPDKTAWRCDDGVTYWR